MDQARKRREGSAGTGRANVGRGRKEEVEKKGGREKREG